jgi:hypothetical protein
VGSNTGALMKHAQHFHKPQLDALVRIVRETPVAGALAAITNFVSSAVPHNPIMDRLIHRNNQDFAAEAAALAWYIDARFALDQFENPLFKNFTEALGDRTSLKLDFCGGDSASISCFCHQRKLEGHGNMAVNLDFNGLLESTREEIFVSIVPWHCKGDF